MLLQYYKSLFTSNASKYSARFTKPPPSSIYNTMIVTVEGTFLTYSDKSPSGVSITAGTFLMAPRLKSQLVADSKWCTKTLPNVPTFVTV
jgi:hypothetical protein